MKEMTLRWSCCCTMMCSRRCMVIPLCRVHSPHSFSCVFWQMGFSGAEKSVSAGKL